MLCRLERVGGKDRAGGDKDGSPCQREPLQPRFDDPDPTMTWATAHTHPVRCCYICSRRCHSRCYIMAFIVACCLDRGPHSRILICCRCVECGYLLLVFWWILILASSLVERRLHVVRTVPVRTTVLVFCRVLLTLCTTLLAASRYVEGSSTATLFTVTISTVKYRDIRSEYKFGRIQGLICRCWIGRWNASRPSFFLSLLGVSLVNYARLFFDVYIFFSQVYSSSVGELRPEP